MWFKKKEKEIEYINMNENLITLELNGIEKKLIDLDFNCELTEDCGLYTTFYTSLSNEQLSNLKIFYDGKEAEHNLKKCSEIKSSTGEYESIHKITKINYYDNINRISYWYYCNIENIYHIIPNDVKEKRKEDNMNCFLNKMCVSKEEFLNFLNKK